MVDSATQSNLDQYYLYGDVYDALEVCDQLDTQLQRLKRQHLIGEREYTDSKQYVGEIRERLQQRIAS